MRRLRFETEQEYHAFMDARQKRTERPLDGPISPASRGKSVSRAPRGQTEAQEQMALIAWARVHVGTYPALRLLAHIPNGGKRGIVEAARFKQQGVLPGLPDLVLFHAARDFHGWLGEMKAAKGKLSAAQTRIIKQLREEGYYVGVFHGWTEARDSLVWYLSAPLTIERFARRRG